jgi:hypothetical protein
MVANVRPGSGYFVTSGGELNELGRERAVWLVMATLADRRGGVEAWEQHGGQHEKEEEGAKVLADEEFEQKSCQGGGRHEMQEYGHGELRCPHLQALGSPTHRKRLQGDARCPGGDVADLC